jgi:glycosyltransferase involved in cell wall biosynthesis
MPQVDLSVVVAAFETDPEHFRACISSLQRAQAGAEGLRIQIVIVIDADERTHALASTLELGPGFELHLSQERLGVSGAKNYGVNHSLADHVIFVDSDDVVTPDCFRAVVNFIESLPNVDLAFGSCPTIDYLGFINGIRYTKAYYDRMIDLGMTIDNPVFSTIFVGHPVIIKRSFYQSIGGLDSRRDGGELTDFLVRAFVGRAAIHYFPTLVYLYRRHSQGFSRKNEKHVARIMALESAISTAFGIQARLAPAGYVPPYWMFQYKLSEPVPNP